jgi:FixJ family two-component response regulator
MPAHHYVAIVDDDDSVRRSLGRLLQQAGFQPIPFASGNDFLADPLRDHFGCVLVDASLHGMTAMELQRQLIGAGPRVPIIYIASQDDPKAKADLLSTGCAGYFRKTDPAPKIIEAIRRVVRPARKR